MKRKFVLFLTVLMIRQAVVFSQTNPLIKYLPDNASTVINFNATALAAKIPAESFHQSFIYQEMMKDSKLPFYTMLMNPEKSGIDISAGIFLVLTYEAINKKEDVVLEEKSDPGINIFIKLRDATLFTANMKEFFKETGNIIVKYGTDNIVQTEKSMTVGWNNDVLVFTSASDPLAKKELQQLYGDTTQQNNYEKVLDGIKDKLKRGQRNICFDLLTAKPQNSLTGNSQFINLMNNTVADIKSWNNGMSSPSGNNKIMGMLGSGLSRLQGFTGKSNTSIVNFENGKITFQSSNYPNDEVAAVYKKYTKTTLNTNLSRRLPKGKLLGIMSSSYNPQMAIELMEKSGLKEILKDFKQPLPFDFNLIAAAFGSNIMVAVIKADETEAVDSLTRSMNNIKVIVAMPIANKVKFDELKTTVKHVMDSLQLGEDGSKMMKGMKPSVRYNDSLFVLSLSPDIATAFLNNSGTESVPEWLQSKSQYPMVMSVDMKEIIKMALGKKLSAKSGKEEQLIMDMFDQMVMYGGNYENESLNTTMEFKFSNQNENALKQLFDMINLIAGKNERVIKEENESVKVDSIKLEEVDTLKKDNVPPPIPKSVKNITIKPKAKVKDKL